METSIYKSAAAKGLRFPTPRGSITAEDLFQLSLTELDQIYRNIAPLVASQEVGLLRQKADTDNDLRLAIVKDVFETKQAAADAAKTRAEAKARKARLLELIEQKRDESLAGKSVEELTALVGQMEG